MHARAVNDRQTDTVGLGKDFQKKNGLLRSNGCNSKTKGDIVMGPTEKMVTTRKFGHLNKKWNFWPKCAGYGRFWVGTLFEGRQVPDIGKQSAQNK